MKKFLFLLMFAAVLGTEAYAKHDCNCSHCSGEYGKSMHKGGFNDTTMQPMSVASVAKQSEDTYVTMQGFITKRLSDDEYHFSDATGSIVLKIKDKVWHGQVVSPKDKIVVFGVVEENDGQTMVDVKSLKIVN